VAVPFWISSLLVSQRTYEKISNRHGLRVNDLREALECRPGLRGTREQTERGPRLYVHLQIERERVLAVLVPHEYEVDVYYLASAYRP